MAAAWRIPCLACGQGADTDWSQNSTDTPPCSDTAMGYGWYSFDREELEGQEVAHGRAGIMLHGDGSACGWPQGDAPLGRHPWPTPTCSPGWTSSAGAPEGSLIGWTRLFEDRPSA